MSPTDIFVVTACAFLGFFIVSSMMGNKQQGGGNTQSSNSTANTVGSRQVDLRKKSDKP